MYTAEAQSKLVAAVLDQLIWDATCDPSRLRIKAHRLEAEQAKRDALRDLRSMARHPERWPLLAFLCEHTELPPADVVRGLHARVGLPYQRVLRLQIAEAGELAA